MRAVRVGNVGRETLGLEEHALRHGSFPQPHRYPEVAVIHARRPQVGRQRQPVRTCPDNRNIDRVAHAGVSSLAGRGAPGRTFEAWSVPDAARPAR